MEKQDGIQGYKKRKESADLSGVLYEHKMSLLLYTKATSLEWDFKMAQNMLVAYDFDDIVINFPRLGKTFFMQLKHKKNPVPIAASQFQNFSGDFSLFKYFKSYCLIKQLYDRELSDFGKFEDFVFVIYTNALLDESLKTCVTTLEDKWVNFLNTKGEAHYFNIGHFKNVRELLKNRENYKGLLKNAADSPTLLSQDEEQILLTFLQTFSNSSAKKLPNSEELQKELKKFTSLFETAEKGQATSFTAECFEDFLKQFIFFSKQSSQDKLDKLVLQELEQICMVKMSDGLYIDELRKELQNLAKKPYYITPSSNFWMKMIVKPWILRLSKDVLDQLQPFFKIKFSSEECRRLLVDSGNVQIVKADKNGALLSLLKIRQCLKPKPHILISWKMFSNHYKEVLSLWQRWCDVVVLLMDSYISLNIVVNKVNEVLMDDQKKLIIVTEYDASFVDLNASITSDIGSVWNSLSVNFQQELLAVKMIVQGSYTTFGEAIGAETHKWKELVTSSFVLNIMEAESTIRLGRELVVPHNYIERPLQLFETLSASVIRIPKAQFAISGISEVELKRKYGVEFMFERLKVINKKADFIQLASKYKNKNIHWLHYDGIGFIWKESVGDLSDIVRHVDVHSSKPRGYDPQVLMDKRRLILTAESGMGKSTFLSHMAAEIKNVKGGSMWIARINLENHHHTFEISTGIPKEMDLILAAEEIQDKNVARVFLEMMLKTGRVVMFFDSFDEVSHYHSVLHVLGNISRQYPDITVWVATRPVSGGRLETLFQMLPYSLPYFTYDAQRKYLLDKWTQTDLNALLVQQFIEYILKSVCVHPCGVPLLLHIISETYQEELKAFVNDNTPFTVPKALDDVYLHKKYIKKMFEIYCKKNEVDKNLVPVIEEVYMEYHMLLSLKEVVDINRLVIGSYLKTKVAFLNKERIQSMGIINFTSQGSSFRHRSFAEYFTALWFKSYYASAIDYLRYLIFKPEFQPTRKFLDCFLTEGFPLHSKIINGQKKICLPRTEVAINREDIGGRTPLHLMVLVYKDEMSVSSASNCKSSLALAKHLLDRGANPNVTDQMLGWSCAQYAEEAKAWALLELMLEYGVHYHCLTSVRNKLAETPYRDTLLITIARCGFTHLLESVMRWHVNVNEYVNDEGSLKTMLHIAVEAGYTEIVEKLVNAGVDVNRQMKVKGLEYGTALHIAAQKGNQRLVECLLRSRALLNVHGYLGRLPIEEAAVFSKWKIVCYLSDQGAVLKDSLLSNYYSPLVCATKSGKLSVVKHLFKNHSISFSGKENVVCLAVELGKLEILKFLVSQGLTLHALDTSIEKAARFGMSGVVKYLIQNGITINFRALYAATVSGKCKMVNFLRKSGVAFKTRASEIKAFHEAVSLGNVKALHTLLENVAVDERNNSGWTALHLASWVGNTAAISFLLRHGANINAVTEYNGKCNKSKYHFNKHAPYLFRNTALHLAAARGKEVALKLLIHKHADINKYNKDGETALHVAANRGHYTVLNYLSTVYNINKARTRKTDLVLHCAVRQKNLKVVQCLLDECGAEVNAKGRNGSTALCLAAEYNNISLVLNLLWRGADVNERDDDGNTPLILAARCGSTDLMHILLKRGAAASSQNRKGSTALHVATGRLHFEAVHMLITKSDINLHLEDNNGYTALGIAHQRSGKNHGCQATIHKYQKEYTSSKYASKSAKMSSVSRKSTKNKEKCICIDKYHAYQAKNIVAFLQRNFRTR